ncbi:MAG: PEP-CTERM system TPR-repeat protein PrsT [Candidatus Accumulibacter sp.]|nr:PEP-CTERM system TPR-repeat protein PrsT [Accumulibacter sp.]
MNRHLRHGRKALLLACLLALAGCDKSPEEHFQQAQKFFDQADYKAAILELKTGLQQRPDDGEARLSLARAFIRSASYQEAETELLKARDLGLANDRLLADLADVYVKLGKPQQALDLGIPETGLAPGVRAVVLARRAEAQIALQQRKAAEESIAAAKSADADSPVVAMVEATLALVDGNKERAGQLVDGILQRDDKFTEALYVKAGLRHVDNKLDEAKTVYQQILANQPDEFRANLAISDIALRQGDLAAADAAVQAAEKSVGKIPMVLYARGNLELRRGNPEAANVALLEILRVAPEHVPTLIASALASYGQGDYQQSIAKANKVLAKLPGNLLAAKLLADSQLRSGDSAGALATLTPLLAKYPDDPRLQAIAGDAYLQSRDYARAMRHLDRAAELEPDNVAIKNSLASGHLAQGDGQQALADLEQAVRLNDKTGQTDLRLVLLHLKRKEFDQALTAIANLEKKLPDNPLLLNLRADALLGKQDRAGARKALEQALTLQPTFISAATRLARLDLQDKNLASARQRFASILERDKDNMPAMLALAELAGMEKREAEYVEWLEKASAADAKAIEPRAGLVRFYLAKKENQKALSLAIEASQANPDSLTAQKLLADTRLAVGERAAAIDTWRGIIAKEPSSPELYLNLAQAQMSDQQWPAARETLQKALQLKADFLPALDALIKIEIEQKNLDAALRVARQMQSRQPASPMGFAREADLLLAQQRYPAAVAAFEQALAKGAGTPGMIKLHRALLAAGDKAAAEQRLTDWLKQYPKDLTARAYAGDVYLQANDNRQAIDQYEALLQANPDNIIALNNLASLYQRENDPRAAATAERALVLSPDNVDVQDTLGWILVEKAQLPRALTLLGKAAAKRPQSATVRYHFGVALARAGKKPEAKRELTAALGSGRSFPEAAAAQSLLKEL